MKYKSLRKKYDGLETNVFSSLIKEIKKSKVESKHVINCKCIPVNVFDYKELVYLHGKLVFIDAGGYQYSLYCDCSLEDLINILTAL